MAVIALISPTPPEISALGVRSLAAYLKKQGHEVQTYLLPGGVEQTRYKAGHVYRYSPQTLSSLINHIHNADIIGLSFMTNYFDRAVQITRAIQQQLDIPLVWGGVHPTVCPEECIEYVDYLCIGEGELAFSEFIERLGSDQAVQDTPNFWVRTNGQVKRNSQTPLIHDLDSLPFLDFATEDNYSLDLRSQEIVPQDSRFLEQVFPIRPNLEGGFDRGYYIMTERGCPFSCTYCINNQLRQMAGSQKYLRRRSISHVLGELKSICDRFPFVKTIIFFDDTLAARPLEELKEFAERFPLEIGLPFHGQVSPTTISPEKWHLLLEAGMIFVEMGIQTGNERIRQLYNRTSSNEDVRTATALINTTRDRILEPCYHVILDNPWETASELVETLELVLTLPRPFWLKRASLVLYPGTALFHKANEEGLIQDAHNQIYRKHLHTPYGNYLNFLFYLSDWALIPRRFIRWLASMKLVSRLHRPTDNSIYKFLMRLGDTIVLMGKGLKAMIRGDFKRINRYLFRTR
ncbi:B12-binding domain-containing radical SAM protein [bacterium]|nr:B12-binding domain-containing radical SAM protein [bacterium]